MMMMRRKKKLPKGIQERKLKNKISYVGRMQINGKRYTITKDSVKEVQKAMNDLRYKIENNIQEDTKTLKEKITLNEWYDIWIKQYKELTVKKSSLGEYKKIYNNHIKNVFGNMYLDDISSEQIQVYYNNLAKSDYKRGTVLNIMIVLGNIMKQAYINEHITKNPCNHIIRPRLKDTTKKNLLSLEDEKIFLSYCKKEYRDIFTIALYTGMRANEILGLTWRDIDFKNKLIYVNHTLVYKNKNNYYLSSPKSKTSQRGIPMLKNVFALLENLYNDQDKNTFVFNTNGIPLGINTLNKYINCKLLKMQKDNIDIKHLSMHSFRHTFATRCIEQGVTPQTLKAIMGHSNLSMTMDLYAHVQIDAKQKELSKLENILY